MFQSLTKKMKRWIVPKPPLPVAKKSTTLEQSAQELVVRARQGDQNAMGFIVAVRDAALAGNHVARAGFEKIVAYAKKVPVRQWVSFGAELVHEQRTDALATNAQEAMRADYPKAMLQHIGPLAMRHPAKAIVSVANGPTLLQSDGMKPRLLEIAELLTPEQRVAFAAGVKHCDQTFTAASQLPEDCRQALMLGVILGFARRLQAVRIDTAPIKILCPVAAWELGE